MRIQLHSLQLVHFEKSILTKKQYKETSPNSYGWFYDAVVSITDFESVHLGSNPSEDRSSSKPLTACDFIRILTET